MTMSVNKEWYVYVLVSLIGRTYVGCTVDIQRRLCEHNGLMKGGAKSTRIGRPWQIAATYGPFDSRSTAQRIEASIKKLRGKQRLHWTATNL